MDMTAIEYEAPTLSRLGSVEDLTLATSPVPTALDDNYPVGSSGNIFS